MEGKKQEQILESPQEKALRIKLHRWTVAMFILFGVVLVSTPIIGAYLFGAGFLTSHTVGYAILANLIACIAGAEAAIKVVRIDNKYQALKNENRPKKVEQLTNKGSVSRDHQTTA